MEFGDFECPHCRSVYRAVEQLLEEYGESIHYVMQGYPLDHHPGAMRAALAAHCAGEQGRFWEYVGHLMTIPGDLEEEDLQNRAVAVGLDVGQFRSCDRAAHRHTIEAAIERGQQLGVTATPTLFINGRRLVGNRSYAELRATIEEELAWRPSARDIGVPSAGSFDEQD